MLEILFYAMTVFVAVGVFAKLISVFVTGRVVKAASQIHKSNHKLMRLVKAKFEHASMISDKVQNVEAFVEKYIYEYKVLGIRIGSWRRLPQKILLLVVALGVFTILESYRQEGFGPLLYGYLRWTGVFVVLLFLVCFLTEEQTKLNAAKIYMVEYLENVCIHRYAKANQTVEETVEEEPEEEVVQETDVRETEEERRNEREMQIRAILEEFLA